MMGAMVDNGASKNEPKPSRKFNRRNFVKFGLTGLAGAVVIERTWDFLSESTARARIVIVGGGAAGITMAAYLTDIFRHDDITLIEPAANHHYQPGYTLIAGGVFEPEEIVRTTRSLIPKDTKWLQDSVTELNPDGNSVLTARNGKVSYDFLVLVPGCQVNFDLVPGIAREELGRGNIHCIYDYRGSIACRDALKKLPDLKEGRLVFTDTYTKLKCGGAPKKICLMAEDRLRSLKRREAFQIEYYASHAVMMKPKIFGDRLATICRERDVAVKYNHRLVSVDPAAKKAVFEIVPETSDAAAAPETAPGRVTVPFDFLHYVPPMSVPSFVRHSPLADSAHPEGWVKVDKQTMVHPKYKNVLALGDVASLASKTGAAIRMQAPIAAANLRALVEGKEPRGKYNGYSACPIITEYGKVLMCEFGYDEKLMPTLPFLDPGIERGIWWTLKVHGLKPMYYHGMLKGLM